MIELKNITKEYGKYRVLNNVNIKFRDSEFVSIIGPSGSGKTTLLNIIGGLDNKVYGKVVLNGIIINKYKDKMVDSYRNSMVGFVFQNYNLISHLNVLSNVEVPLTLRNIKRIKRKKQSIEMLKKVGLKNQIYKMPSELSGGEKQRVAIARALVNNPRILLLDEPTGALDSKTSVEVMDLIKKLSKDKLVIMITHNNDLAKKYSDRIVNIKDGMVLKDTNPCKDEINKREEIVKKKNLKFKDTIRISLSNLKTKRLRTALVSFAGSIGILGISLILSLSNGIKESVLEVQKETLYGYPIVIEKEIYQKDEKRCKRDICILDGNYKKIKNNLVKIDSYLRNSNIKKYASYIDYNYDLDMVLYKDGMKIDQSYFRKVVDNKKLFNNEYMLIDGKMPKKSDEAVLIIDNDNNVSKELYHKNLSFKDALNLRYNLIIKDKIINIKIVGVAKRTDGINTDTFIGYTKALENELTKKDLYSINIYPSSFENRVKIKNYLKKYDKKITYNDYTNNLFNSVLDVVKIITYILSGVVGISLLVSSIMIAVITYVSYLERTKEIGILKSVGASYKDIIHIFNSETIIEGFIAGVLGNLLSILLCFLINVLFKNIYDIDLVTKVKINDVIVLILLSITLSFISGIAPSLKAGLKNPVESLRYE